MTGKRLHRHLHWTAPDSRAASVFEVPVHDPPLAPRDEAIFLLHTGAEIEHALLVQYLYAAYSLRALAELTPDQAKKVRAWRKTLLNIAREEMGHLITVQNLLRLIGGPITLEREDYPFRNRLYPFHFRLEPLSRGSLAKYVVAEMPYMADPPDEIKAIVERATATSEMPVNHVGTIYARVLHIFSQPEHAPHTRGRPGQTVADHPHLADDDFVLGVAGRQAHYGAWGGKVSVLVPDVANRVDALAAITELAEQGEGLDDCSTRPSHYQRFLDMYREFPEPGDWQPAYLVPVDPNTGPSEGVDVMSEAGRITNPRSLKWARLFNLRYRLLLEYLGHFLQSDGPLADDSAAHTPRGLLNRWTFDEMRHMSQIASRLALLPRTESDLSGRAGAPFELPYTLDLPDREQDRWRSHADVLNAAIGLEQSIAASHPEDAGDDLLQDLEASDTAALEMARDAMYGRPLPAGPVGFKKVVQLLEDGVRGFRVGAHHNFWRGITRDEFVAMSVFGNPLIAVKPDGSFDAASSNLIKALRGEPPFDAPEESEDEDPSRYPRMPAEHPPLPPAAIDYIYRWIEAGCPEDGPSA